MFRLIQKNSLGLHKDITYYPGGYLPVDKAFLDEHLQTFNSSLFVSTEDKTTFKLFVKNYGHKHKGKEVPPYWFSENGHYLVDENNWGSLIIESDTPVQLYIMHIVSKEDFNVYRRLIEDDTELAPLKTAKAIEKYVKSLDLPFDTSFIRRAESIKYLIK